MKVLFCGTILPEAYETELQFLSSAANRFQWNIINTLKNQGHMVEVLSYVGFPIEENQNNDIEKECHNVGIEVVVRESSLLKSIRTFRKKMQGMLKRVDSVWVYNVLYPWLGLGKTCIKYNKKSVLILADFSPEESYMDCFYKLYVNAQKQSIRQFDLVVGLSENVEKLLKPSQDFIHMEGGINVAQYEDFDAPTYKEDENLILMYSGLLSSVTGVDLLLEAFTGIEKKQIELVITGKGNLEAEVIRYAQLDSRIHYCGQLVYEEYLKNLKRAHILLNPRNMNLAENQNNFPSKIMEYLASGRRIISTKFVGYERFEGVICFCETDVSDIRLKMLEEIETFKEDIDLYVKQKELSKTFDWRIQVERIINTIKI